MRRLGAVALIAIALAVPACADDAFKSVVKGIEAHYGIRRLHPHLLGFAMFIARPAMWGSGAHGVKLAVFEDERRNFTGSTADLDGVVAGALGPKWQPFVRVQSRRDKESSVIYANFSGKRMRMMIASIEADSIAVVHVEISPDDVRKWIHDPTVEARGRIGTSTDLRH